MALERLALIVRSAPWARRGGRDALDIALAAATLDIGLQLFFIGDGVLQLLADKQPGPAGLPPGLKAWAGLPELAPVRFHVDPKRTRALNAAGARWLLNAEPTPLADMATLQASAQRVLVV